MKKEIPFLAVRCASKVPPLSGDISTNQKKPRKQLIKMGGYILEMSE
jgi:hypothetical protein